MSSILLPIARGISFGTGLTDIKRMEDSVRVGRNALLTTLSQTSQVHYSFTMADQALSSAGFTSLPVGGRVIGYLTPAIIALFIKRGIENTAVRKCALFIQDSMGNLCQLASIVSAVAMVAFGHIALGITSGAIIATGFLDRGGLLPESISNAIHTYSPTLRISTGLVLGDLVEKFMAMVSIVIFCFEKYIVALLAEPDDMDVAPTPHKDTLDIPLLEKILNETVELEVNPFHLSLDLMEATPSGKLQDLMTLYEAIDLQKPLHMGTIRLKISSDERLTELYGSMDKYSDAELIERVKINLQSFIDSVQNRQMNGGQIHDFNRLELYLKAIAYQLPKEDEITQVDCLLSLGIDGGEYCGPGKFHRAEERYCQLALRSDAIAPQTKVLLRLQDVRTNWFTTFYGECAEADLGKGDNWRSRLARLLFNFQDLHAYNVFLKLYGRNFGLRSASADNDYAAPVDPITKQILKKFSKLIEAIFKYKYTENFVVEQLQQSIGNASIPTGDLYTWWTNWVDRQEISPERKEQLKEEIGMNAELLSRPLQSSFPEARNSFNAQFLKAMALDLGILKVKAA